MEASSTAAIPTTVTSQEFVQEEPLESGTPLFDGGEAGVAVKLNEDDEDARATMRRTLPQNVIIQSNHDHTYLRYNGENPNLPNAVHFGGDYSFGLETRYEVVPSSTGTGLVHIRSYNNNKYLAHFGTGNQWVTAMAVKPEENQSNQHCTLFRPHFEVSNSNHVCRLQHVNTGQFVRRFNGTNHARGLLTLWPKQYPDDKTDEYTFINWETDVAVLPDLIRIKGDNGNYLRALGNGYMDYNHQDDNSGFFDFEVSPSRNGGIRLTNNERHWVDMDNNTWVLLWQLSDTTVHHTNTVFLPRVIGNRVVLRGLKSNRFCKRFTDEGKTSCLATRDTYLDNYCYMEIEEPVHSRTVNNVRYHLADASIHTDAAHTIVTRSSSNGTDNPITAPFDIRRTVSNTTKWSNSLAWSVGFKITFQRGVLDVSSYGIEISAEFTKETDWEETETETIELGSLSTITVPPKSRVEMSLIGTRVSYDVPFSYTQRDVLKNGTVKVYHKNDGLLHGTNGYDYKQDIVQLPLPPL